MKRGIYIGRFQPFHNGHLSVVKDMQDAKDLDEIIIGIGTAQIGHTRTNPFTADEREMMIKLSIQNKKPYHIIKINDINDYPKWVEFVESLAPKFDVVYSGNTIVKKLFEDKGYEVRQIHQRTELSATKVRENVIKYDDYLDVLARAQLPEGSINVIKELKGQQRLRNIVAEYGKPCVAADVVCYIKNKGFLFIKRAKEPFKDMWALPGGHWEAGKETVRQSAARELGEETETEVKDHDLRLIGEYSAPGRDPRGHYVTIAYFAELDDANPVAKDDAKEYMITKDIPDGLAFDHNDIVSDAIDMYMKK